MQPELIAGIRSALRSRAASAAAFSRLLQSRSTGLTNPVMYEASLRLVTGHEKLLADFEAWVASQGTPAPADTLTAALAAYKDRTAPRLGDAASDPYSPPA